MRAAAYTEVGTPDKPGEDWFGISDSAHPTPIVVLDGGTARTNTGCAHGVSWYAHQLGSTLLEILTHRPAEALPDALSESIQTVADLHRHTCDLSHPGTPSAAVAVVRPIGENAWEHLVLGDVTVVFGTPAGLRVIVDHRISQSAPTERAEANRWPIGSPEKEALMVAMKHVELAERNRSYWIAASDPAAATHALTGVVFDVSQLGVLTDGAARVQSFGLLSWPEVIQELSTEGPASIVRRVREAEAADPLGKRWPRNKRSDDATVVYAGPWNLT